MSNPCKVCGSTDLSLVDGFYYCVECGTQDTHARETIVEQTVLADGTFAHGTVKKLTTVLQNGIEMSGEWHKWHAFNFMLAGLTDELIALGAKPNVKVVVLWIWTRYIKKFQVEEDLQTSKKSVNETNTESHYEKETQEISNFDGSDNENSILKSTEKKKKIETFSRDINIITKGTLLTILYLALNLDKSDIQLSHLLRFIKEGRLSLYNCFKYLPKEIDVKSILNWRSFDNCHIEYKSKIVRTTAMTFLKRLDLGAPVVPDISKMICTYIKELCLPREFKDLVLALMNLLPCDFLKLNKRDMKAIVRVPDFEVVCMSYILLGLKMCFGLDDNYEVRLSDEVNRINIEENYPKSYKLGMYAEPTDRLFSFRDWYKFLQFRKIILCRYYLPMARIHNLPVDDYVLMEHLEERERKNVKLSDDVTMDILNKISETNDAVAIPKKDFPPTLTPMTTYTDVIMQYIQDPDLKLFLCEDFSQYSLKYTLRDFNLPTIFLDGHPSKNIVTGVNDDNKIINVHIIGTLKSEEPDKSMVFVRNCENKNWLKTKPPTIDHIVKAKKNSNNGSDKESDLGYDSNTDSTMIGSDDSKIEIIDKNIEDEPDKDTLETIEEENEHVSIFDDNFHNLNVIQDDKIMSCEENADSQHESLMSPQFENVYDSKIDIQESIIESSSTRSFHNFQTNESNEINLETFDRKPIIDTLIRIACKKYKIPYPKEMKEGRKEPRKRKADSTNIDGVPIKQRRVNIKSNETKTNKELVSEIISGYYKSIENDALHTISEHIRSIVQNIEDREDFNNTNHFNTSNLNSDGIEPQLNETQNHDESEISSIHPNSTLFDTCADEDIQEDSIVKDDPKFDPKTHDIRQLYVKINEDMKEDNINNDIESDPELCKIIDQKIEEFSNKNIQTKCKDISDSSDSEDELPLSTIVDEKLSILNRQKRKEMLTEPLIPNDSKPTTFNFWLRHYKSRVMSRRSEMSQKFDLELVENCPVSFVFVIRECAAILNCSAFSLYKCMQMLEETLLTHI